MRIHTGLIRYSNTQDIFRIFSAVLFTSLTYFFAVQLVATEISGLRSADVLKTLLINFFISSSALILLRTAVKESFLYARRISTPSKERVVIFGTNKNSVLIKQALELTDNSFIVVGFVDINSSKVNSYIEQKKVFHAKDIQKIRDKFGVNKLLLVNEDLGTAEKKSIINKCLQLGVKVVTVPPSAQWVYGKLSLKQIKDLNIEDLLQREPIVINNNSISKEITGKTVLVTGAAGSIGSEIVRQVLKYNPATVVLCDQAESALHDMQLELDEKFPDSDIKIFVGNIQNFRRMQVLFSEYKPEIIFHAAAYKHVPMMEKNPSEAILTNVMGTKNIADLSIIHKAEKFVMISTDKAVNPTNIMGASKRIAEMYIQSLNNSTDNLIDIGNNDSVLQMFIKDSQTKFVTTRFGNVLDSNGSVIPRFRAQIQKGGPVTVTDPEITRYFMTIPESVQLVLEAGTMGNGGEIFIFDMGTPVRIVNLAKQMIKLAGLVPDQDIKIVYSGLRPGEKLYEELLNDKEKTLPTHHEKIKIAKVASYTYEQVLYDVEELILLSHHDDDEMLVTKMKEIVPEFISNNSVYEKIDQLRAKQLQEENLVEAKLASA
jgi:FlaA1/EpsC-like NDP-sugar epimerase